MVAAIVAVITVVGVSTLLLLRRKKKKKPGLQRTVSFTSIGLAKGTFPKHTHVPATVINAACYFDNEPPTVECIIEEIIRPLLVYERFSSVMDVDNCRCRPCRNKYEPKDFVRKIEIHGVTNLTNETIFKHHQDDLQNNRKDLPWWEILLIRNTANKGASACVIRVHHALADGISLVHAFHKILKTQAGDPLAASNHTTNNNNKRSRPNFSWWSFVQSTFEVMALSATKYDTDTAFSKPNHSKMVHNGIRNVCILPKIPLDFIKQIKTKYYGCATVNDILMTVVSQAIHDYCLAQNDTSLPETSQCRALMPVGFPPNHQDDTSAAAAMTNKWCVVSCDIAVGESDILQRLQKVCDATKKLKSKPTAYMQLLLQNHVAPLLPESVARQTCLDVFSRHSLVLTNVPGPPEKCRLAGKVIDDVQMFFNNLITQTSLISYGGNVYGNIVYDPEALPGLQEFGNLYGKAFVQLAERLDIDKPNELLKM